MKRRDFLGAASAAALVGGPALALAAATSPPAGSSAPQGRTQGPGERLSLDKGWRFHGGDIAWPRVRGDSPTYDSTKTGAAAGAAGFKYDDAGWRELDLPHDFVVEGPFDPAENPAQGYRPKGVAWYRRRLKLDPADHGKHLELQLDAIAVNATVWFNGVVVLHSWSAYSSAYIDITALARYGADDNLIAVRVDADPIEGWWYEGGGLYRHTWLVKRAPVHIVTDGVYAHPRLQPDGAWIAPVEVTVENTGAAAVDATVRAWLVDAEGRTVAQAAAAPLHIAPLSRAVANLPLPCGPDPRLWSVQTPTLYTVRTTVEVNGATADRALTSVGFRTQHFDPDKGFSLNGKPLKIKGVCIHQDHAGVGVAVPDAILEFRLRRLKAMGANAIRSSHHAPSVELLDLADRLGLLIMDENRIFNTSPDYMDLLEWLVRRDRNHPSIILWSVFNEEPLQGTEAGYEMVRRMAAVVKRLDDSRPVTAAMSNGMFEPVNVSQAVDVVGFNYQIKDYDRFHAANPTKPMTSSEDTSAIMSRGEYRSDPARHVVAAYDDEFRPWGATHRAAWQAIAERPFLAGGFVWTGFDYRGEPQPFEWPSASSVFGAMDLCGFPKTAFYIRQAQWLDTPVLHLEPHWNWSGREGQPIRVMAISNAESVELILNGVSLGEQNVDRFAMNQWQVPYAPGRLEAVARTGGKVTARTAVETTGPAVALRLTPDRKTLRGDGRDATVISVQAVDAAGRAAPIADASVAFAIAGGRIIGLGNGDANSHEPEKGNVRSLYNGLAQVIVQTDEGSSGALTLDARATGLKPARAQIAVAPDAGWPSVARPA